MKILSKPQFNLAVILSLVLLVFSNASFYQRGFVLDPNADAQNMTFNNYYFMSSFDGLSLGICTARCMQAKTCLSFSYNSDDGHCRLYNVTRKMLLYLGGTHSPGTAFYKGGKIVFLHLHEIVEGLYFYFSLSVCVCVCVPVRLLTKCRSNSYTDFDAVFAK